MERPEGPVECVQAQQALDPEAQTDHSENCLQAHDISLSLLACHLKTPFDAPDQVPSHDPSLEVALYPIIRYYNIRIQLYSPSLSKRRAFLFAFTFYLCIFYIAKEV